MKKLLCWWRGHREVGTEDQVKGWYCIDCGIHMDYDEALKKSALTRIKECIEGWKDWWRCPECGGRFGKHDDDELMFHSDEDS